MLGPAPEGGLGGLGTIDLLATALPSVRPGGPAPAVPPPPSEFRFSDAGASGSRPAMPPRHPTPVSVPVPPPPRAPAAAPPPPPSLGAPQLSPPPAFGAPAPLPGLGSGPASGPVSGPVSGPMSLDDDILGGLGQVSQPSFVAPGAPAPAPPPSRIDPYFKQVFDQFIAVKRNCGESISGLTYEKFTEKLIRNRDDLMAKTGCREVRFTVYVKDGKAALKATPVKPE